MVKRNFNELRPPQERVGELIAQIKSDLLSNDVICLQEAFEPDVQARIIKELRDSYPYSISNVGMRNFPCPNSGLMLLSKHPIEEAEFHRYPNLFGEDTLSNKGFLGAKIRLGEKFVTVYNTHTQAGGGFLTPFSRFFERIRRYKSNTTSSRRDEQFSLISQHMTRWGQKPPRHAPHLTNLDVIVMGDVNSYMNDRDHVLGISQESESKVNLDHHVQYPGKNSLFKEFDVDLLPDNFFNINIEHPLYKATFKKEEGEEEIWVEEIISDQGIKKHYKLILDNDSLVYIDVTAKIGIDITLEEPPLLSGKHPLKQTIIQQKLDVQKLFGTSVTKSDLKETLLLQSLEKLKEQLAHVKEKKKKREEIEKQIGKINLQLDELKKNIKEEFSGQSSEPKLIDANYSKHGKALTCKRKTIIEMRNKKGWFISDHHGLKLEQRYPRESKPSKK